jgi:hypothetical protein
MIEELIYGRIPNEPIPKNELPVKVLAKPNIGFSDCPCENISKSTLGTGIYNPKRTKRRSPKIFVIFACRRVVVSDIFMYLIKINYEY